MTDAFDPYSRWLGIRPDEQPVDHYRLLGVRRFEFDQAIIESAADARLADIDAIDAGEYAADRDELFAAVDRARRCLLDSELRAQYNDRLMGQAERPLPSPKPADFLPPTRDAAGAANARNKVTEPAGLKPPTPRSPAPTDTGKAVDKTIQRHSLDPSTLPPERQATHGSAIAPLAGPSSVEPVVPTSAPLTLLNSLAPLDSNPSLLTTPSSDLAPRWQPMAQPASPSIIGPPTAAPPVFAVDADAILVDDEEDEELGRAAWLRSINSMLASALVHMALFVALGLLVVPVVGTEKIKELLLEFELVAPNSNQLVTSDLFELESEIAISIARTDPSAGLDAAVSVVDVDEADIESSFQTRDDIKPLALEGPKFEGVNLENILGSIQVGGLGDGHEIVDNYQEVLDRITQELLMLTRENKVLVVWLFDRSESMDDDQREIADRIQNVYAELESQDNLGGESVETAIASFGESFLVNTPAPTKRVLNIRDAMTSVSNDPSGKEMMCQAVMQTMATYGEYAKVNDRKLVIFLVTDESGEQEDNVLFLEPAIAAAKTSGTRIYVLGREAAFGAPFAKMRWIHPLNGREHWLPVDRGPESAFVEQLQTDGFGKRIDVHPSGFGPYGQARLARETGGTFFMLPSQEVNLVRGESRRFELEVLAQYRPDLRSRGEIAQSTSTDRLKAVLTKVINDINPYREEVSKITEVRRTYSGKPEEFLKQAVQEKAKAVTYLSYLNQAIKELEKIQSLRDNEASLRWQANYDLAYAQLLAYAARTYEYIATVEDFVKDPPKLPLTKSPEDGRPGKLELFRWDVKLTNDDIERESTKDLIERSREAFNRVLEYHEGTPWAARAEWELQRGFGVQLAEQYRYVAPPQPKPAKVAGKGGAGGGAGSGAARKQVPSAAPAKPPAPVIVIPKL